MAMKCYNQLLQSMRHIIRSFEPELKRQSCELHTKNSPRPVKFCRSQNCAKMLMIFAYDFHGVLMAYRVLTGETVNKEYYKMYIRTILRPAICRKCPDSVSSRPRDCGNPPLL